jgi:hypothetical protein
MKKIVLFGIAVAAMLTACSNDDVVDVKAPAKATPIGFNTFVENATRGEGLTKDNIAEFAVWGFTTPTDGTATQIFNAEAVTRTKSGNDWSPWDYKNTQYWVAGNTYTFAAISPVPTDGNGISYALPTKATDPTGTITFTQDADAQRDLVYAYDNTTTSGTVGFTFDHLLSRVAVKVTNSTDNSVNTALRITNVKITGAANKATLATAKTDGKFANWSISDYKASAINVGVSTNAYPLSTETNAATVATDTYGVTKGNSTQSDWSFIVPIEDSSSTQTYTITFDVEVYQAVSGSTTYIRYPKDSSKKYAFSITTSAAQAQMAKGNSYIYTIELSVADNLNTTEDPINPIKFSVEQINGWTSNSDVTVPEKTTQETTD